MPGWATTWTAIALSIALMMGMLKAKEQIKRPERAVPWIHAILVRLAVFPAVFAGVLLSRTFIADGVSFVAGIHVGVKVVAGVVFVIAVAVLVWTFLPVIHDLDPPDGLVAAGVVLPLLGLYRPRNGAGGVAYEVLAAAKRAGIPVLSEWFIW